MPPLYVWCYQKIWYPFQRICRVSWWRTNFFFVFPLSKFKTRQFFSNTTLGIKPKLPPKLHVAKSPMSRLGMSLSSSNSTILTQSGPTKAREKEMYIKPWISATRTLCYLALNRQNKVAVILALWPTRNWERQTPTEWPQSDYWDWWTNLATQRKQRREQSVISAHSKRQTKSKTSCYAAAAFAR